MLKWCNCGAVFIWFIRVLHKNSEITIEINLILCTPIEVESGVRQGCPIAPMLFAIVTQPFNCILCSNCFNGVQIRDRNLHCSMYADDTTLYFVDISNGDINRAIEAIKVYEEASGAALNLNKCSLIPSRKKALYSIEQKIPAIAFNETDRLLGVQIGATSNLDAHWLGVANKIVKASSRWCNSKFSLLVKAKVVKIFLISIAQYYANFSLPPMPILKIIKTAIWQVFFGKQIKTRVSRDKCCLPIEFGGLNAFNVEIRFQATLAHWAVRFIEQSKEIPYPTWTVIFNAELECIKAKLENALNDPKKRKNGLSPAEYTQRSLVGNVLFYSNKAFDRNPNCKSVSDIYRALLPVPTMSPIFNHVLTEDEAKSRWKWISIMPANGKLHDMRWRLWHKKLLLKCDEKFNTTDCQLCGAPENGSHLLTSCPFGKQILKIIQQFSTFSPTSDNWETDWVSDDISSNPTSIVTDTILVCGKWGVWRTYCDVIWA